MRIPSYDDLTPSIPDIGTGETLARVKGILPGTGRPVVAGSVATSTVGRRLEAPPYVGLFACLRSADASAALVDIARDFSPRLERHGSASVVLDVGGLGRLLGESTHGLSIIRGTEQPARSDIGWPLVAKTRPDLRHRCSHVMPRGPHQGPRPA